MDVLFLHLAYDFRCLLQFFLAFSMVGHYSCHEVVERRRMILMNEVAVFVAEYEFYQLFIVLYQLAVDTHSEFTRVAAPPSGRHLLEGIKRSYIRCP